MDLKLPYVDKMTMVPKLKAVLDACTICQLNCAACGIRLGEDVPNHLKIGKGYLSLENFKKFIALNKNVLESIEFSNSGEPFLNPELPEIIKYAYEQHVPLYCDGGTNFNAVSDELIKALVDYSFRSITISLDGADQESYVKYRVGGNFDTVIENIKRLNAYKKEKHLSFPELHGKYIVRESTEDEALILKAKKLAKELNMHIWFSTTGEYGYCPKDPEKIKELTGVEYTRRCDAKIVESKEPKKDLPKKQVQPKRTDKNRMQELQGFDYDTIPEEIVINKFKATECLNFGSRTAIYINGNGELLGCCLNKVSLFGINVFETPLLEIFSSPIVKECQEGLFNHGEGRQGPGCLSCPEGKAFVKHNIFDKSLIDYYNNRGKVTEMLFKNK